LQILSSDACDFVVGISGVCRPWQSFRLRRAKHCWLLAVKNISDNS